MTPTIKKFCIFFINHLLQLAALSLIIAIMPTIFSATMNRLGINNNSIEITFRITLIIFAIYVFLSERIKYLIDLNKLFIQGAIDDNSKIIQQMKIHFPKYYYIAAYIMEKENPKIQIRSIDPDIKLNEFHKHIESENLDEITIKKLFNQNKINKFF